MPGTKQGPWWSLLWLHKPISRPRTPAVQLRFAPLRYGDDILSAVYVANELASIVAHIFQFTSFALKIVLILVTRLRLFPGAPYNTRSVLPQRLYAHQEASYPEEIQPYPSKAIMEMLCNQTFNSYCTTTTLTKSILMAL